ncbi:putative methyltransferase DDB_G0268948, partial [Stegodyphus dumicola]|uniref:putative methyltransferase DDB_G0268948 n=1 Tax=Stegodyphus dumicola TaxID=202533 RepID=UPI0015AF0C2F
MFRYRYFLLKRKVPETYHMANQQFADEEHAQIYRVYRPDCPQEVADLIISYLKEKFEGPLETAVDVGCGSGQSTTILAPFFKHVHGLDVSEMQIKQAKKNLVLTNITYKVSPAEILPFETGSVQLVTAGACLHWFQRDIFFPEVRRVLSNNGVFAAYTNHSLRPLVVDPVQAAEVDRLFYK